jgi:hypothetical protein
MSKINQGFVEHIREGRAYILADLTEVTSPPPNIRDFEQLVGELLNTSGLKGAILIVDKSAQAGLIFYAGIVNLSGFAVKIHIAANQYEAKQALLEINREIDFYED